MCSGTHQDGALKREGKAAYSQGPTPHHGCRLSPSPGLNDSETPKNFSIATFLLVAHPQSPAQPELSEGGTGRTVGGAPKDHAHSTAFRSWSELLPPATRAQILNRR